jgi:hypothetical protein
MNPLASDPACARILAMDGGGAEALPAGGGGRLQRASNTLSAMFLKPKMWVEEPKVVGEE